ncbi:MAG: glutathione S-transferase family protein [Sneathiellales bacterium]|nr:glutathione S-transferase family protein [Sneathiellales bacterium]
MIELYAVSGAPRPRRVMLALMIKELDYNIRFLDFSKKEHLSDNYLSLNPRGRIPTLVDGDIVIHDSIAAMLWLDRAYPEKPLFGENTDEAADQYLTSFDLADFLRTATDHLIRPIFFGGDTRDLSKAAADMRAELELINNKLEKTAFIGGNRPGAADCIAFPEINVLERALQTAEEILKPYGFLTVFEDYPALKSWTKRMQAMPGYEKTYPPHWR